MTEATALVWWFLCCTAFCGVMVFVLWLIHRTPKRQVTGYSLQRIRHKGLEGWHMVTKYADGSEQRSTVRHNTQEQAQRQLDGAIERDRAPQVLEEIDYTERRGDLSLVEEG